MNIDKYIQHWRKMIIKESIDGRKILYNFCNYDEDKYGRLITSIEEFIKNNSKFDYVELESPDIGQIILGGKTKFGETKSIDDYIIDCLEDLNNKLSQIGFFIDNDLVEIEVSGTDVTVVFRYKIIDENKLEQFYNDKNESSEEVNEHFEPSDNGNFTISQNSTEDEIVETCAVTLSILAFGYFCDIFRSCTKGWFNGGENPTVELNINDEEIILNKNTLNNIKPHTLGLDDVNSLRIMGDSMKEFKKLLKNKVRIKNKDELEIPAGTYSISMDTELGKVMAKVILPNNAHPDNYVSYKLLKSIKGNLSNGLSGELHKPNLPNESEEM